ncbi:MAG: hypothetical protein QXL22_03950 [Candidatus Nezhaarchaeales archaeon]
MNELYEAVGSAILYHSYSYALTHDIQSMDKETKVLKEVDKLDAFDAIGFVGIFLSTATTMEQVLSGSVRYFREKMLSLHIHIYCNHLQRGGA